MGRIERLDPRFDALVPRGAILEKIADGIEWAEGPLWDARDGSLLFSDVPRQGVFRLTPDGALSVVIRDLDAPNGIGYIAANHRILRLRTSTRGIVGPPDR